MEEYYKIGKLAATFGFKGEMVLKHSLGKRTTLKGLSALFVEDRANSFIPWFILATRIKSEEETFVALDGINTKEEAAKLLQKEVWMKEEDFNKYSSKSAPINLLGFEVIDEEKSLGPILEVIEQPHQILARLSINDKEVLIPLHEETILHIDRKKKQVRVGLPPGLLEIYL